MLVTVNFANAEDGCVFYFQTFSKLPIPEGLEKPQYDLEYYMIHDPR